MKKVAYSDIGFYGKPIDSLSREELLEAIFELVMMVQNCADKDSPCRSILSVKSE
ncbi:MAG: hypothetical protein KKF30_14920 [Proteobacteria bacterium]|nr:hypothetical protein [Pseudomonadota bacterium]MBU4470378.1 hypothetical protein [Pseudomonadota bacterium]MCG2753913.1 hypothetical protein [Desulfobacteraceae bacterium]